ncbi:HAD-IIIC family phosphatase [Gilliamella sp. B2838]|uniref:HAD-IIIC family phosphatase n=1 Tax=Gilliamella sp. B2838 TaxID=2818020 RepID=UPI00226A061F|nr:HAD-IIIC family phosphatase [Gilliamella sp. B2838]MCX8726411.1 HAD-IIIC family phosphatase [Gilliamella sp. B2838]
MKNQIQLQKFIFEDNPSRLELLNLHKKNQIISWHYSISVYRNHSFELIENTIYPYLDFSGTNVKFEYSDYDDSLSFFNMNFGSDLLILWIDFTRYRIENVDSFIEERMDFLKKKYKKPILFIPFGHRFQLNDKQVVIYNLDKIEDKLGEKYIDLRLEKFSGTKLSSLTCLEVSKELGLNYIPSLLKPNLKGIIVDLDNTLYKGVLGEDGINGVILTVGHQNLQNSLKKLKEQGFFICIASKNNEQDVIDLFNNREDFPLSLDDFTKIYANWGSKSESIGLIAKYLNVNTNSLLFIDDNTGELHSAVSVYPNIHILLANNDANITNNVLNNYPGLLKLNVKTEDSLRQKDTQFNEARNKIINSLSKKEYFADLKMELEYCLDNIQQSDRISELANKTNQFIFNYKRYSFNEIENLVKDDRSVVISISLRDRLSDSGIIGGVIISEKNKIGILEECFISCRALGRGIDNIIVLGAVKIGLDFLDLDCFEAKCIEGERNTPALNFFNEYLSNYKTPNKFDYQLPDELVKIIVKKGK